MRKLHIGFPCTCSFDKRSMIRVINLLKTKYGADEIIAHSPAEYKEKGEIVTLTLTKEDQDPNRGYNNYDCHEFITIQGLGPTWVFDEND